MDMYITKVKLCIFMHHLRPTMESEEEGVHHNGQDGLNKITNECVFLRV